MASGQTLELGALLGQVSKTTLPDYGDLEGKAPGINANGELRVVQALSDEAEIVRYGETWTCTIATGSAFTYVNAWPTTRAELVIYNGYTDKSLIFRSAFMVDISSAAAAHSKCLLGQLALTGIAAPTDDANQLIYSRSGRRAYGGQAKRAVANTAFAIANKWEALAGGVTANTATIGTTVNADLLGGWIVPPGGALCLAGVASTAAGTAIIGATWHERKIYLG